IALGLEDERLLRVDAPEADASHVDPVHDLAGELELEARAAKSVNAPVRFVQNLGVLHGVLKIEFRLHSGCGFRLTRITGEARSILQGRMVRTPSRHGESNRLVSRDTFP